MRAVQGKTQLSKSSYAANAGMLTPKDMSPKCAYRLLVAILAAVMCLSVAETRSLAQQITGTLVGSVYDAQGASMVNAMVTATNEDTGLTKSVTTNAQGQYRLAYLAVGSYTLQVSAPGFKSFERHNIVLTVDQVQQVNASLSVGQSTETITVSSELPLINLSTSETGRIVEANEVLGLPLVNRNVYEELTLTPGVQSSSVSANGGANFLVGFPAQQTVINGGFDALGGSVSYYLDGGLNMNGQRNTGNPVPNPDALQEFRVETNNYNAQYGRFSSGVITVLTRSGTNHFHGSLFEFVRNTAFNATPWGTTMNAPYHRNQFGGVLGGKIIPDRTFFLFSYAGLRQATSRLVTGAIVPTTLERAGNFSQSKIKPIDPATGLVYNYNGTPGWIPPTALDPTAMKIVDQYIPSSNAPGSQWTGYSGTPFDTDEYLGKIDHQISANNHLSVSYFTLHSATTSSNANLPNWNSQTDSARQQNVNIGDTQTFNPSLVNQIWLTYTRLNGAILNSPATSLGDLGSSFTTQGMPSLPALNVSGYFNLSTAIPNAEDLDNFYSFRDVISKTIGKHALDFGGEMSLDKEVAISNLENFGKFTFSTSAPHTTKNALADFVTGRPASMVQATPISLTTNGWYYGLFLEDNYRATRRLTLNLGIRYDLQTPPTDPQDRELTFVPGRQSTIVPSAPKGLLFPGDPGVDRGTVGLRLHHISPRAGIVFDPFGNGKTSLRAAAGVFYGGLSANEWNQTSSGIPFDIRQTFTSIASLTNIYGDPASFPNGDPFPYYYSPSAPRFLPDSGVAGTSLEYQWPYSYQLNASVQQQVMNDLSVTIAYVGSLSHHVPFMSDVNYPAYVPGATTSQTNIDGRRPYDSGLLGAILMQVANQTGSYNALQISVSKRMSHGLMLNGFYVWSHSLTSAPPSASGSAVQDHDNVWEERGPSDQDQRNMASISGKWDLNYYRGSKKLLSGIVNGWSISPIITMDSGTPLNLVTGTNNNAGENNLNRPNLVSGQNAFLDPHRSRAAAAAKWFNTAAFVTNGPGLGIGPYGIDGNTPRNYLRSPGYKDVDLGIFRTFRLGEKVNLQARGEALNAFNLVSLSSPVATLSSPADGKITSASAMREIQLGLRMTF